MDKMKAKNVLMVLERINKEIDLMGKILINNQYKPVPVWVKNQSRRKFK